MCYVLIIAQEWLSRAYIEAELIEAGWVNVGGKSALWWVNVRGVLQKTIAKCDPQS